MREDKAQKLVGGAIYFHKKQKEPSFFGGRIIGFRVASEGEFKGRIIFKFEFSAAYRKIKAEKGGWSQEMKLVLEQ